MSTFAADFRAFLMDEENKNLLRESMCGHILVELQALRKACEEKDAVIDALKGEVSELREEVGELKATISSLETNQDHLEQYQRRNSLRISGIQETEKEDCAAIALDIANNVMKLYPPLAITDIDRAHRTGKHALGRSRQILVKFATYRQRKRVMDARKKLDSINSRIYVNEDLTKARGKLLYLARCAKKANKIEECWTTDGRVLVKRNDGTKHWVKTTDQLDDHMTVQPSQQEPEA